MKHTLTLLLLLAVGIYAYNEGNFRCTSSNGCKPAAVKIDRCSMPHCYRCGTNQVFNEDTLYCDCKPGYVSVNGVCGRCQDGYTYDEDLMQCIGINPCGINQQLVNGQCRCLPGLKVIQNICQRCPTNQTYFPQYDACRCTLGYSLINGNCIFVPCLENQVYSADSQACVCAQGFNRINGVCGQCLVNEVYNPTTQACDPFVAPECGIHEYYYENCCFCEVGYIRLGGVCMTCPQHSSYDWITDSCVCDPGYYFVGEEVKIIPYQYYDTGSSFTTNPSYSYSYKAPYSGVRIEEPIIVVGSNYDASGINTNGPNINNIYNVPPLNN